jgi:hypothetical protein
MVDVDPIWGRHPLKKYEVIELLTPGFPFPPVPAELCAVYHHWLPGVDRNGFHLHGDKLYGVESNGKCHIENSWDWAHTWYTRDNCPGGYDLNGHHHPCTTTEPHHAHISA